MVSKGNRYGSKGKGKGVKSNLNPHSPSFHQSSQGQHTDSRGWSKSANLKQFWKSVKYLNKASSSIPVLTHNILCSEEEVVQMLQSLNIAKASRQDGISAHMLRATAIEITPSITKLFNLSVQLGQPVTAWKSSNVVPIPRKTRHKESQ